MRRWLVSGVAAGLSLFLIAGESRVTFAKPDYTRRTKKECSFCHPPGGYTLNEAGKYYRDHRYSLEGYKPDGDKAEGDKSQSDQPKPAR